MCEHACMLKGTNNIIANNIVMLLLLPWRFASIDVLKLPRRFPHTLVATENMHICPQGLCSTISGPMLHVTDVWGVSLGHEPQPDVEIILYDRVEQLLVGEIQWKVSCLGPALIRVMLLGGENAPVKTKFSLNWKLKFLYSHQVLLWWLLNFFLW